LSAIRGPGREWVPRNSSEPGRMVDNFPGLRVACEGRFGLAQKSLVGKAQGHGS